MAERKLHRARVETRPRFRCLVCKRFVLGTEHGTCPSCGWEPPSVTPAVTRRRPSWTPVLVVVTLLVLAAMLGWIRPGG